MGNRYVIRELKLDDVRELFLTGIKIFSGENNICLPWNEENLGDALAGCAGLSIVAMDKKKIAGFIIATIENNSQKKVRIVWAGVINPLKGKGVEERLYSAFMDRIKKLDFMNVEIIIQNSNGYLINFFKKIGFTEKETYISLQFKILND